jgi:hypothetical protein
MASSRLTPAKLKVPKSKRTQLARLEEERRKLDDEQKAFRDHLARLRKAKDQDEFDRFMAERNAPPPSETPAT